MTDTRLLYESFAWAYDEVVAEPAGGPACGVVRRLRSLGVPLRAMVIDAGCGTGRYAHALSEAGFTVIGVDRSAALIELACERRAGSTFVCADFMSWQPREGVDAVICRGVLNDLTDDDHRRKAFKSFGSWLRPGGVLLADVRDWHATAARYGSRRSHDSAVKRRTCDLRFSSVTHLDHQRRLMLVRERWAGTVDEERVDASNLFVMRPWTAEEARTCAASAGFASIDVQSGADAGIAPDRLLLVGRR